ncbi:hypothetical protein [Photobacterium alginatilyticum]|uniref:Uncharacterized protein n=1 Tax=Photobacterium alginatilyticum TaxID=1775171 RepID=A0ABW9YF18_9GAMM|nr:hypothetical protein [Photobacterium alginatilyticum]NBI51843.1 hypothetical protein [Photobacterium alginatilyticum]
MDNHPADIGLFSRLLNSPEGVTTPQSIAPVVNAPSEAETTLTANQAVRENQGIQQIRQWADRLWLSAQRDNLILTTSIGSAPVTVKSAVEQGLVNITIYCADPTFTDKMRAEKRHLDRKPSLQHVRTSIRYQELDQQPPAYDSSLSSEGNIEEIQV